MERLTYVDARGRVLFTPSEEVDENPDIGYDIRQIAEYGYREYLSLIAERLANREQYCEMLEGELKTYKDAEEQGLLFRLPAPLDGVESFSLDGKKTWFGFPCNVGDDVYFIPSKVNFELNILNGYGENNRVYHQKIKRITLVGKTWYVECDKDIEYGTNRIHVARFFKKTWFLSQEEAEAALEKMKGGAE